MNTENNTENNEFKRNANIQIETANMASKNTSHLLHFILSIITIGFWIPVWVLITISNSVERSRSKSRIQKIADGEETGKEGLSVFGLFSMIVVIAVIVAMIMMP